MRKVALVVAATVFSGCDDDAVTHHDAGGTDGSSSTVDATTDGSNGDTGIGKIQTVFVIMMSHHSLTDVQGSSSAPYYNGTLLPAGARATMYKTPPGNHPAEPNYIWLEAGNNLGITNDDTPANNHKAVTVDHLTMQLDTASITWKAYAEDITAGTCPLVDSGLYVTMHMPMLFFDDVVGNPPSASSTNCISHVRPFSELATDLSNHTVARYNFITPNRCDDSLGTGTNGQCSTFTDLVKSGDDWLAANVPTILASQAYLNNGALFIIWDEGSGLTSASDGPLPFVVLSPKAKINYPGTMAYTHSSTFRTFEAIFGVPYLRDAVNATDLSDLFTSFP